MNRQLHIGKKHPSRQNLAACDFRLAHLFPMTTCVLPAHDASQIALAASEAARLLAKGEIVALPTETVYGLGCDALNPAAVARVFAAKERPSFDPLIVHVEDAEDIHCFTTVRGNVQKLVLRLAENFWPGPLTLVLPASERIPDIVRSGLPTVALRCSAHPVMQAVLKNLGHPIAAPSANRFGRISPVRAEHVVEELEDRIPLVLDGGPCCHGLESTIVAVEAPCLVLLRPGPVTQEQLEQFAPVRRVAVGGAVFAPGMMKSHYAPRTPLYILAVGECLPEDAVRSGLLTFGNEMKGFAEVENLSRHPLEAAPHLFAALRRLDASGVSRIYAHEISESGLGMAIMDRLRRAAHE